MRIRTQSLKNGAYIYIPMLELMTNPPLPSSPTQPLVLSPPWLDGSLLCGEGVQRRFTDMVGNVYGGGGVQSGRGVGEVVDARTILYVAYFVSVSGVR